MTPRTKQYLTLREQGLTYREIAEQLGVSYQAVAQVCARSSETRFRKIGPDSCVYPGLRNWMNENRVSRAELYRRMHGVPCIGRTQNTMRDRLIGVSMWKKNEIDRLLEITGMTYEQLFGRATA